MRQWIDRALPLAIAVGVIVAWRYTDSSAPSKPRDPDAPHIVQADRTPACGSLSGEAAARLAACLDQLPAFALSASMREDFVGREGQMLVIGDQISDHNAQISLAGNEPLTTALLGRDERAASEALKAAGIRSVLVHRDLTAALDRDDVVLARLAHHDALRRFELRRVGADALLYTVRSSDADITDATGAALVGGLRARIAGAPVEPQAWRPDGVQIIAGVRTQGQVLVLRHARANNIEAALDDLAEKIRRRWERDVEVLGMGTIDDRLKDLRIEVHVVLERAEVEPRGEFALFDLWEMGIDGAMLTRKTGKDSELFGYMPGSEAVARSIKSADAFLQHTADTHDFRARRPWERADTSLDLIRDAHFLEARGGGGEVVRMVRGAPDEPMTAVNDENVRQMLVDGAEWWVANQYEDGSFLYKYWPEQHRVSREYNEVRHILGTRDLAAAWKWHRDPRYLQAAVRAMDWLERYEVSGDGPAYDGPLPHPPVGTVLFRYPGPGARIAPNQKLGTVAVALLAWVEWARVTGSHEEDERIRRMARFVQSMQQPDGRFEPYYVHAQHGYYGQKNDIVPGEAALALGEVAEYFNDPTWVASFPKFLDYYEPWFRERAKNTNATGRWPHTTYENQTRLDLVQFGPWSVMASAQYYRITGDARAATFGLEVAEWMIDAYQWRTDRTPWPDYAGGYYKMPGELPAMQSFCYSEGTAAAYDIAVQFAPDRKAKFERATAETIGFLRRMQYDEVDSYAAPRQERVFGGVKYAMNEGKIRIDYVGHALSTLAQYLDARAKDPDARFAVQPRTPETPGITAGLRGTSGAEAEEEDAGPLGE